MGSPRDRNEKREFLLSQYLDGQLDDAARAGLEAELSSDPELRKSLEQMRRVDQFIHQWGAQVPDVDADRFVAVARQRCETYEQSRKVVRVYRVLAALAMAAVIGLIVTGYLFVRTGTTQRPEPAPVVALVSVGPAAAMIHVAEAGAAPVVVVSFSQGPPVDRSHATEPRGTLLVATAGGFGLEDLRGIDQEETPVF